MSKEIGIVGLGKMGGGVAAHLAELGWRVVGFDLAPEAQESARKNGVEVVGSVSDLVSALHAPRTVWVMLHAGEVSEKAITEVAGLLAKDDTVIDAANAFYEDTLRRADVLKQKGLHFIDIGYSGGPHGARHGGCLMIGGDDAHISRYTDLFTALALKDGWQHVGSHGAGHFVKMVHNGIEYGMMQSLAEGIAVLKAFQPSLDLNKIAMLYNHGSVIESRLVGWLESGFKQYGTDLTDISGTVAHTGEGEWTVKTAEKLGIPVPSIKLAFDFRVQSKEKPSYTGKVLSMLRNQFGGHAAK
jgi:6-phosphogluconate dehydrogenase